MGSYLLKLKLLLFLLMALNACQKSEFTEPVTVQMEVKIAEGGSAHLNFNLGYILFEQILFDGQREQGGEVHFSTEPDKSIGPIAFAATSPGHIKKFDIPQGVYSHMQWRFILDDIDDNDDFDDEDESDEELDLEGGLIIAGTYKKTDGTRLPLYIVIDDDEQLLVKTEGANGYGDITLITDNSYVAQLIVDPYYAFQPISVESLERAEISSDDGQGFIEISTESNEALYESILLRIESSVKVIIK